MSKSYRREVAKKLKEIISTSKDERTVIEAANVLAKYIPKPKQPKRRPGTPVPTKPKEPSLDELVAAAEKKRKEKKFADKAALNGGSTPS